MNISPYTREGVKQYNLGVENYVGKQFDQCEAPLKKAIALFLHDKDHERLNACFELLSKAYSKQKRFLDSTMLLTRQIALYSKKNHSSIPISPTIQCQTHGKSECKDCHLNNHYMNQIETDNNSLIKFEWVLSWKSKLHFEDLEDDFFSLLKKYSKSKFLTRKNGALHQIFTLKDIIASEEKKFSKDAMYCTLNEVDKLIILLEMEYIALGDIENEYRVPNYFIKEKKLILNQLRNFSIDCPFRSSAYQLEYFILKHLSSKENLKELNLQTISDNLSNLRKSSSQNETMKNYLESETILNYLLRSIILYNRYIGNQQGKYSNIIVDTKVKLISKRSYIDNLIQCVQDDLQSQLNSLNSNTYKEIMMNLHYSVSTLEKMVMKFQALPFWKYIRDIHQFNNLLFTMYHILNHLRQLDLQRRTIKILKFLNTSDIKNSLQLDLEECTLELKEGNNQQSRKLLRIIQEKYFSNENNEGIYSTYQKIYFKLLYLYLIERNISNLNLVSQDIHSNKFGLNSPQQKTHLYAFSKYLMADLYHLNSSSFDIHNALDCALTSLMYRTRATNGQVDLSHIEHKTFSEHEGLLTNSLDYQLIVLSLQQVSKIYNILGLLSRSEFYQFQGMILSLQSLSYSYLIDFMLELVDYSLKIRMFERSSQLLELIGQFIQGFYNHAISGTFKPKDDIFTLKQRIIYHLSYVVYFHQQGIDDAIIYQKIEKNLEFAKQSLVDLKIILQQKKTSKHTAFQVIDNNENPFELTNTPSKIENSHIIQLETQYSNIQLLLGMNSDLHSILIHSDNLIEIAKFKNSIAQYMLKLNRIEESANNFRESLNTISLDYSQIAWSSLGYLSLISDSTSKSTNIGISQGLQLRHQKLIDLINRKKEIEKKKLLPDHAIADISKFIRDLSFEERRFNSQYPIFNSSLIENRKNIDEIMNILPKEFIICTFCLTSDYQNMILSKISKTEYNNINLSFNIPLEVDRSIIDSQYTPLIENAYNKQNIESSKYSFLISKQNFKDGSHVNLLFISLNELNSILKESDNWMNNIDKYISSNEKKFEWWKAMIYLDKRMQNLISFIENCLIQNYVKQQIFQTENLNPNRHYILILDRMLNQLPWEYTSTLRYESCSRIPSLYFLWSYLKDHFSNYSPEVVSLEKLSYVLNPDGDLKSTEIRFQEFINKDGNDLHLGWKKVVGRSPLSSEFESLIDNDIFLYMGHGAGEQYFSNENIRNIKSSQLKLVLLMGCSSVKLKFQGDYEPEGPVLQYISNGTPCMIVGNLWDVTARECDRFTMELLRKLSIEKDCTFISKLVSETRDACFLKYLMGAATVCFGLPLCVLHTDNMNISTLDENILQECDNMEINISNMSNLSLDDRF